LKKKTHISQKTYLEQKAVFCKRKKSIDCNCVFWEIVGILCV